MEWIWIVAIAGIIMWIGYATDHEECRRDRERRGVRDDD